MFEHHKDKASMNASALRRFGMSPLHRLTADIIFCLMTDIPDLLTEVKNFIQ